MPGYDAATQRMMLGTGLGLGAKPGLGVSQGISHNVLQRFFSNNPMWQARYGRPGFSPFMLGPGGIKRSTDESTVKLAKLMGLMGGLTVGGLMALAARNAKRTPLTDYGFLNPILQPNELFVRGMLGDKESLKRIFFPSYNKAPVQAAAPRTPPIAAPPMASPGMRRPMPNPLWEQSHPNLGPRPVMLGEGGMKQSNEKTAKLLAGLGIGGLTGGVVGNLIERSRSRSKIDQLQNQLVSGDAARQKLVDAFRVLLDAANERRPAKLASFSYQQGYALVKEAAPASSALGEAVPLIRQLTEAMQSAKSGLKDKITDAYMRIRNPDITFQTLRRGPETLPYSTAKNRLANMEYDLAGMRANVKRKRLSSEEVNLLQEAVDSLRGSYEGAWNSGRRDLSQFRDSLSEFADAIPASRIAVPAAAGYMAAKSASAQVVPSFSYSLGQGMAKNASLWNRARRFLGGFIADSKGNTLRGDMGRLRQLRQASKAPVAPKLPFAEGGSRDLDIFKAENARFLAGQSPEAAAARKAAREQALALAKKMRGTRNTFNANMQQAKTQLKPYALPGGLLAGYGLGRWNSGTPSAQPPMPAQYMQQPAAASGGLTPGSPGAMDENYGY